MFEPYDDAMRERTGLLLYAYSKLLLQSKQLSLILLQNNIVNFEKHCSLLISPDN